MDREKGLPWCVALILPARAWDGLFILVSIFGLQHHPFFVSLLLKRGVKRGLP